MNKIIQELNGGAARDGAKFPDFNPGDTVIVQVQGGGGVIANAFRPTRGVVIAKKNRGLKLIVHRPQEFRMAKVWSGCSRPIALHQRSQRQAAAAPYGRAKLYYLRDFVR